VLFVAAVLAYPATGRQRLLGVLAGLPLLLGLNLARLVALGWIGVRVPRLFTQAHELWMQAFIILAVALSWIVWARHVDAPRRDAARPRPAREVGKSVLLFVAVVAVAEALGVWAGLVGLYGFIVKTEAVAVLGLLGVRHGGLGGFVDFGLYGSLAGTVALYLATPGVPLRVRMAAAGWWGFVVQVMFHVVVAVALAWMTAGQVEGELTWVGVSFLAMGGPAGIWLLWVRRQRAERSPAGDGAQDFADPAKLPMRRAGFLRR
jgi:exosortase/archaeosortase family protein